ncbi:MAG TPA: peptidoglycan DD-metalloendopeptidase family protein [Stellaceae bacterium]|nr:peptidoglycan DD-metalloendopeptidase family protein [Stellaceae bacterium]
MSKLPVPGRPMAALLAILLMLGAVQAQAAGTDDEDAAKAKLRGVQHAISSGKASQTALKKQQTDLAAEIDRYRKQSVELAAAGQKLESDLSALQARLDDLARQDAQQRQDLLAHQKREAALLAALQRIAIEPPAALAFSPGEPVDSLRSAMLLGSIQPRIAAEAAALSASLQALAATRAEIDQKQKAMLADQNDLATQRKSLADILAKRRVAERGLRRQATQQQRQLTALAARAGSLQEVIEAAEKARAEAEAAERARQEAAARAAAEAEAQRKPSGGKPVSSGEINLVSNGAARVDAHHGGRIFRPGQTLLLPPVSGKVVTRYGAKDGFVTSHGLTVASHPGATVVSPFDGVVLFSGPFRGYGEILIIDHGGGYASLLARLGHEDVVVGQHVVAGEPVGTMADNNGSADFYMEVRHNNQPIDPLPLLQHG